MQSYRKFSIYIIKNSNPTKTKSTNSTRAQNSYNVPVSEASHEALDPSKLTCDFVLKKRKYVGCGMKNPQTMRRRKQDSYTCTYLIFPDNDIHAYAYLSLHRAGRYIFHRNFQIEVGASADARRCSHMLLCSPKKK
jgi:hypothetical protein